METIEKICLIVQKIFHSKLVQKTGDIAISIIGIVMILLMLWAFVPKDKKESNEHTGSITAKTAAKSLLRH